MPGGVGMNEYTGEESMPKSSDWCGGLLPHEWGGRPHAGGSGLSVRHTAEGATPPVIEDTLKDAAAARYAQRVILESDDDSHLSDRAHLQTSSISDPNDVVLGLRIK